MWAIAKGAPKTWLVTDGDLVVGSVVYDEEHSYSVEILALNGAADYRFRCRTIDAARAYVVGVEAGQRAALALVTIAPGHAGSIVPREEQ